MGKIKKNVKERKKRGKNKKKRENVFHIYDFFT